MYDELIKRLREDVSTALVNCDFDFVEGWAKEAADAIEELIEFARFVAEEVVVDDDEWENNQNSFPEIACRKLFKLGIVSRDGEMWHYEPPKEAE